MQGPERRRRRQLVEPLLPGQHRARCLTIDTDTMVTNVGDAREPLPRQRRPDHRRQHGRRRRRNVTIDGPNSSERPERADRRHGLDESDERLLEQQRLRDEHDRRGHDRLEPGHDRLRLRDPVDRGDPRDHGHRASGSRARAATRCRRSRRPAARRVAPSSSTATPPGGSSTASASIAYNASAATVQAALVTIFGTGNVTCSGRLAADRRLVHLRGLGRSNQPLTMMSTNSKASPAARRRT